MISTSLRSYCTLFVFSLSLTGSPQLLLADEPVASANELEVIFRGEVPRTVDQLREMEKRQTELVEKVTPCTVGLQIGEAQGSGVIVSADGIVLTAAHVVQKPGLQVQVILYDGRVVPGKSLGMDRTGDAGMVKINPTENDGKPVEWPHLKMGDSEAVRQGQWCLVTGHPGGYQKGRKPVVRFGRVLSSDDALIVSDCTLVGGDSGGPLLDMNGDVIGIHSRIGGDLTANMHVPVKIYRDSWDRLAAGKLWGEVPHGSPYIGVQGEPDATDAKISKVEPGQPGDRAGIQAGDVIIRFDDEVVGDFATLASLVADRDPGDRVKLEVKRGEEVLELELVIGRRR